MNRLTNEQRLQIIEFYNQNEFYNQIEFYNQNAYSVRKVLRALLPFDGPFNWPATVRWYQTFLFVQNARAWLAWHVVSTRQCNIPTTTDLLRGEFGEHFISSSGLVNWPPRPCDLTPLDYILWDYVKDYIYTDKSASIDALEDNIEAFIREIPAEMLGRVCQSCAQIG